MANIRDKLAAKKSKLATVQTRLEDHPAKLNDSPEGAFYNVDIEMIAVDPNQPRKHFDQATLKELSESIKQKGVLQPVIIRKDQAGKIMLVAGERRFKAAKLAGLEKIPAVMTKGNPLEIPLIENLQRENLKPIEEAEALNMMIKEHDYTQEKLAFTIGKARTTITETLSLTRLPDAIKEECRRADIYPRRLLVEIAKQDSPKAMLALFKRVKESGLKSDQVRDIARKRPERPQRTPAAIALDRVSDLTNHLSKLDFNTIAQSEKTQLIMELNNLKKAIEKIIS
jgi:ParB family chromosome partitioning protein